jgi:hypothetical protein
MLSGFFLCLTWRSYIVTLKKRLHSLVIPYLICGCLFAILMCLYRMFIKHNMTWDDLRLPFFLYNALVYPPSQQFWFLRDLIITISISPLLLFILDRLILRILMLAILFLLWLFEIQPFPIYGWYLINIEFLFFYFIGLSLAKKPYLFTLIQNCRGRFLFFLIVILIFLILVRVRLYPTFDLWYIHNYNMFSLLLQKVIIFVGVIVLISLSRYMNNAHLLNFSQYSFFIYLFHHYPLIAVLQLVGEKIFGDFSFYINVPFSIILCVMFACLLRKILPNIYFFVNGGR